MKNRAHDLLTANAMMLANLLALAISLVITILYYELSPLADSLIMEVGMSIGWFTDSSFFVVIVGVTLLYEQPIRKVLRRLRTNGPIDPDLMSKARKRLLNEPYYLIAADFLLENTWPGRFGTRSCPGKSPWMVR